MKEFPTSLSIWKSPSPVLLAAAFLFSIFLAPMTTFAAAPADLPAGGEKVRTFYRPTVFQGVKLSKPLPTRVMAGTLLRLSGVTKSRTHQAVKAFVRYGEEGPQTVIQAPVRGNAFSLDIHFPRPGTAHLGLVFDAGRESPLVRIEVIPDEKSRALPPPSFPPFGSLGVEARYSDGAALLYWLSGPKRVSRISLAQKGLGPAKRALRRFYVNGDVHEVVLRPRYLSGFEALRPLRFTLSQAVSRDGSALGRSSGWVDIDTRTVRPMIGYPDRNDDVLDAGDLPRHLERPQQVHVRLRIKDPAITLRDHAYAIRPDGFVKPLALRRNGQSVSFKYAIREKGAHVIQVFSEGGRMLLSRAVYRTEETSFPVLPPPTPDIRSAGAQGVAQGVVRWVNAFRKRHGLGPVTPDEALSTFATGYAKRVAGRGVLSHTDPVQGGLLRRARAAGLALPLGENLAAGASLGEAAKGLTTSALHRANLLRPEWSRVGVGIGRDDAGKYYLVQVFAR